VAPFTHQGTETAQWSQRNNGGGGVIFSNVKLLVRKCVTTQKHLFSNFFSCFSPHGCGILETQEIFPTIYCTHKTTYAYYLSLFSDVASTAMWGYQEIGGRRKVDSQLQSRIRRHVPKGSFLIYNCVPRKLNRLDSCELGVFRFKCFLLLLLRLLLNKPS